VGISLLICNEMPTFPVVMNLNQSSCYTATLGISVTITMRGESVHGAYSCMTLMCMTLVSAASAFTAWSWPLGRTRRGRAWHGRAWYTVWYPFEGKTRVVSYFMLAILFFADWKIDHHWKFKNDPPFTSLKENLSIDITWDPCQFWWDTPVNSSLG
jgi:hypothetical protein